MVLECGIGVWNMALKHTSLLSVAESNLEYETLSGKRVIINLGIWWIRS